MGMDGDAQRQASMQVLQASSSPVNLPRHSQPASRCDDAIRVEWLAITTFVDQNHDPLSACTTRVRRWTWHSHQLRWVVLPSPSFRFGQAGGSDGVNNQILSQTAQDQLRRAIQPQRVPPLLTGCSPRCIVASRGASAIIHPTTHDVGQWDTLARNDSAGGPHQFAVPYMVLGP